MSFRSASGTSITELPLPRIGSNEKQVVLPIDTILYISRFMEFLDYRNFVRALWPDKEKRAYDQLIQNKLWQLSTHRFTTRFINWEPIEIEYNFDPERTDNRVLINWDYLRPVFGGVTPQQTEKFLSHRDLKKFVDKHVNLNKCTLFVYASCPCKGQTDDQTARRHEKMLTSCEEQHFHHYCSDHVNSWLYHLAYVITNIHQNRGYDRSMDKSFMTFLDTRVYFRDSAMRFIDVDD
ncbi:Rep1 [Hyposoter didymator ichnovirus]|nr:Rep1 [Hyposoter didymator ichnovirus]